MPALFWNTWLIFLKYLFNKFCLAFLVFKLFNFSFKFLPWTLIALSNLFVVTLVYTFSIVFSNLLVNTSSIVILSLTSFTNCFCKSLFKFNSSEAFWITCFLAFVNDIPLCNAALIPLAIRKAISLAASAIKTPKSAVKVPLGLIGVSNTFITLSKDANIFACTFLGTSLPKNSCLLLNSFWTSGSFITSAIPFLAVAWAKIFVYVFLIVANAI